MATPAPPMAPHDAWKQAREGHFRASLEAARRALSATGDALPVDAFVDLHLVIAFCSMRAGDYAEANRVLDIADNASRGTPPGSTLGLRVAAWRAELAYLQGRYSSASAIVDAIVGPLERAYDRAYAAFALRTRIAVLLARSLYDEIAQEAPRALADARSGSDPYVLVQILNVLGAAHFDCATSKLAEPHARAHLSGLDPRETLPMQDEASRALAYFEDARRVARDAGYPFAAWYVSGNIERLQILLGHADRALPAIRRRLRVLQKQGARYDEIVTRSNLAWGLRSLGLHREALHELDVALRLSRETGTFNVLLEFLEYDRSIVLGALGDTAGASASYRRYVRLVNGGDQDGARNALRVATPSVPKRPLEPHFLKCADRYIDDHLAEPLEIKVLASHCGVSVRTLEKGFAAFRRLTPVAHIRNVRLDHARRAMADNGALVAEVAARYGFRSATTFANEYRKRFGVPPSRTRRLSQPA